MKNINGYVLFELPTIDFSSDSKFEKTLMQRIYVLRCSIVRYNPDFEENKAVSFLRTAEYLRNLEKEKNMIYEVTRTIIIESSC